MRPVWLQRLTDVAVPAKVSLQSGRDDILPVCSLVPSGLVTLRLYDSQLRSRFGQNPVLLHRLEMQPHKGTAAFYWSTAPAQGSTYPPHIFRSHTECSASTLCPPLLTPKPERLSGSPEHDMTN